jgi:oligopeptide transport system substrate-binding protein
MKTAIAARRTVDFQILNSNWIGDYLDPTTFLDLLRGGASNNATGWASAAYDGLLDEASRTMDATQRFDLLRRAESLMLNDAPIAPLFYNPVRFLRHAAVKGWHDNLLDQHPLKAVWLER